MVALICEQLALHGDERVLDVGTGSGYQAAVLAELAAEVHSIERIPELAERARASLAAAGYGERVQVHVGDGTLGLPEHAPFAAIAVAAAAPEPPPALYEQLEPRGRLVVPVGGPRRAVARGRRADAGGPGRARAPSPAASSPSSQRTGLRSGRPVRHDGGMGSWSGIRLLQLPRAAARHPARAGPSTCSSTRRAWHALGFVVRCGDECTALPRRTPRPSRGTARSRCRRHSCCSRTSSSTRAALVPLRGCSARRLRASGGGRARSTTWSWPGTAAVEALELESRTARVREIAAAGARIALARPRPEARKALPSRDRGRSSTAHAAAHSRALASLRSAATGCSSAKFCVVGAVGYVINLAVYDALLHAGLHYLVAATCSFLVAVTSNYTWNRLWTFRDQRGHVGIQGMRFFVVSLAALGANLARAPPPRRYGGLGKLVGAGVAIVLVTPLNFVGNKLWSFRRATR